MTSATVAAAALLALLSVGVGESPPPSAAPNSIAFWTSSRGLIGTDDGIELTADGGATSRLVLRTGRPVGWVSVAGTRAAWAVIPHCAPQQDCASRLLRSADGGRTWAELPAQHVWAPSFADARHGVAVASATFHEGGLAWRGRFLATADGGRTWHERRAPCGWPELQVVSRRDGRGWALCSGQGGAGKGPKAIYRTRDGGRRWSRVAIANPFQDPPIEIGGILTLGYAQGISFAADGLGVLWESRGTLYVTRDGGHRWHALGDVARAEVDWGISAWMIPRGVGFALLERGTRRLVATRDGGRTWRVVRRWR